MDDRELSQLFTTYPSPSEDSRLASMQTRSPMQSSEQWPAYGSTTYATPLPAFLLVLVLIYIEWGPSWGMPTLEQLNATLIWLSETYVPQWLR